MYEIERKFLLTRKVRDIIREQARANNWMACENIQQVYMPKTGKWAVRGRRTQTHEFSYPRERDPEFMASYQITMKRKQTKLTAIEIETATLREQYEQMVAVAGHRPINKNRWYYGLKHESRQLVYTFMIDEFLNPELDGLVLAEIELESEDQWFPRPEWLGEEVTGVKGYSNAQMVERLRG